MALYKNNMEAKLTESEERYRLLVEHSPDGIAIEKNNKITFINSAALKILRATRDIKYEKCSLFDFLPPENLEEFKKKLAKANENHSSIPFIEEKFVRTDGSKFDAEIAMIPFANNGKIALQIIFRDITGRKKADEELRKAYAEIKKTQQALINSEKLAALGRFSAGIAHEIRNPLANISASAQFCTTKFEMEKNMKKHFDVIQRNTESANRIIKELLDFTSPRETPLFLGDVNTVIDRVCELVKPRCTKHNISLIKKIQKKLPSLAINDKKLEEAFMNFLSNAIEAMPKGGTLTVESYFDENDNSIIVKFSDTGLGISQEDLDKVFEPFFTTKDDGTGLGLSLAYHNVNAHSGNINIESKKGNGTTFSISFPLTGKNGN
jgi:two-component system sporulation sensor kinase A